MAFSVNTIGWFSYSMLVGMYIRAVLNGFFYEKISYAKKHKKHKDITKQKHKKHKDATKQKHKTEISE